MSIELIQTMEWTQLFWDMSFESIIDLENILPEIGKSYPIKIDENENFVKEGAAFLLWRPPHSELNGWYDKRPSEILKSYVLDGVVKNKKVNDLEFDFDVKDRIRLIDLCNVINVDRDSPMPYIGRRNKASILQYLSTCDCVLKAKTGDYWYLHFRENCYALIDIILSYIGSQICIHYYACLPAYGRNSTQATKYSLDEIEQRVMIALIEKATGIFEVNDHTLQENQVYGAEYW
jgi:hypothetical protein